MFKGVFTLYLVCFGLYLLFTRQPDYFDGERSPAKIVFSYDSLARKNIYKAVYFAGTHQFSIDARYPLRSLSTGDQVSVIYETATPEKAAVYTFWGYWIGWGELLVSVLLCIALFQIAVVVTSNPSAEALIEQLEYKAEKKTKYKT